jgi:hypothetical protein
MYHEAAEFVSILVGAAASWPLAARAQQAPVALVGLLSQGMGGASFSSPEWLIGWPSV